MVNPSYKATVAGHEKMPTPRDGILLVNLGTPDGTDYWSMRRYLKEFLSDPRVIETNRLVWWFILNVVILSFRPFKSGHAYASIWDKKRNESPLRVITRSQAEKLQKKMGKDVVVRWAMRYGQPAIKDVLDEMKAAGCVRIKVLPLYPQYAGATVGSVGDEIAKWSMQQRTQPAVNIIAPYYDDKVWVKAVARSIEAQIKKQKWVPDVVMASFHGIPLSVCKKGDVYYCHSHKSARLIAEEMGSAFCRSVEDVQKSKRKAPALLLTFQSRFGREEWLQPYTAPTLEELARGGAKKVLVVCPGFSADCVETLEEIAMEAKQIFVAAGGEKFGVVACLNDSEAGMKVIEKLVG